MLVLFINWGLMGAKDKYDIFDMIKFAFEVTYIYFEWTFYK